MQYVERAQTHYVTEVVSDVSDAVRQKSRECREFWFYAQNYTVSALINIQPILPMQNTLRLFTLTLFIVCSMAGSVNQGRADEAILKEIFQSASQMPSFLKSYQFSFTLRGGESDPPQYQKVDVWQSGSNIKTISTWVFPDGEKMDSLLEPFEYAFNGTDYQWFSTGRTTLTFSKKCRHPTPYWTPNPLMCPYDWLMGQQANWSDIKDIAKWEARFKEAKYLGPKVVDGVHLEAVSFPFLRMNVGTNMGKVYVYFAKDLNYYPVEIRGFVEGLNYGLPVLRARVIRYKTFDVDGMLFVFPLSIEVHDGADDEGEELLEMYWTVDESSIKINPQLDEDMFTISPSRATTVTDYDKMLEDGLWLPSDDVADDGRDIVPEPLPEPLPKRTWNTQKTIAVVVVNLVLLALLIYLLLRKKR